MAQYVCKVGDSTGRIFQQLETAQNEGEVRQKLLDRGFMVLSVKNDFNLAATFGSARRQKKLKLGDFLIFNQQFNTLMKAGTITLYSNASPPPPTTPAAKPSRKSCMAA